MSDSTRPSGTLECANGDTQTGIRKRIPESRWARYDPSDLPSASIRPNLEKQEKHPGDVMTDAVDYGTNSEKPEKLRKSSWWWPAGVVASSLAGAAAVVAFRGCWHGKMGWPVGVQGYSYQVCLRCGAMRLFDEKTFSAYGPFRNDLNDLIAWQRSTKPESHAGVRPRANVRPPTP